MLSEDERAKDAEAWAQPVFKKFNAVRVEMEKQLDRLTQQENVVDNITPSDSISQVSKTLSKASTSKSRSSRASSRSSIAVARAEAAAKRAELLARAAVLREKQALENKVTEIQQKRKEQEIKRKLEQMRLEREREEEERKRQIEEDCVRHEQEKLEVKMEIAAAEARLRALENIDETLSHVSQLQVNESAATSCTPSIDVDDSLTLGSRPYATEAAASAQKSQDDDDIQLNFGSNSNEPVPSMQYTPQDIEVWLPGTNPYAEGFVPHLHAPLANHEYGLNEQPQGNNTEYGVQPASDPVTSQFVDTVHVPDIKQSESVMGHKLQRPEGQPLTHWQQTTTSIAPEVIRLMQQQNMLIQQQSNMTQMFMAAQEASLLPKKNITPFAGDPLEYCSWVSSFKYEVEDRVSSSRDKLQYLEQFTAGEVKKLVRGYQTKDPDIGYQEAKEAINKIYGNKFKLTSAYLQKVQDYPHIKAGNSMALNNLALFLLECKNALEGLGCLSELNHTTNIKTIVNKLPFKMKERWRSITTDIQETRSVTFDDLVSFVTKQSRITNNPVYGDIGEGQGARSPTKPRQGHIRSLATEAKPADTSPQKCLYCDHPSHKLEDCRKLFSKTSEERIKFLRSKGLCFGCLKQASHRCKDCKNKLKCKHCSRYHPSVLHQERLKKPTMPAGSSQGASDNKATCGYTDAGKSSHCKPIILPVLVRAKDSGVVTKTYAFLDDGSDAVFCSNQLNRDLRSKGEKMKLNLKTINQSESIDCLRLKNLEVMDLNGHHIISLPEVFTHKEIPASKDDIVTAADIQQWPYLKEVEPPASLPDIDIGLLIGNNVPQAMEPLQVINSQGDGPYAYKTVLGWVVHGIPTTRPRPTSANRIIANAYDSIEKQLEQMYNHDFNERLTQDKPELSLEDQRFMKLMAQSTTKTKGHYELPLPFRDDDVKFPDNQVLAEYRLAHLKRKFIRQPDFKDEYTAAMTKTIEEGYAVEVPEAEVNRSDGKVWYIPHHGVRHPQKRKLRVVYDCAASFKSVSLNQKLLKGPDLTSSLIGVLLRFRRDLIAVIADIEAMYHQVKVQKSDQDLLRFLWWPNGDINQPAKVHRMTSHIFGAKSSPACANYALQALADEVEGEASYIIRQNFYVDDCLCSTSTTENAVALVQQLKAACMSGGFNLTKWMSNSKQVLSSIPQPERAKEAKSLDLSVDSLPAEKALGVLWNAESDSFGFNINITKKEPTRRGILSMVSAIYDPLGFIAPCTLPAKILMQDLCKLKLGWDDEIPSAHLKVWQQWLMDLPKLEHLAVKRCFKPLDFGDVKSTQLHHFADASQSGYGTVSYLRSENMSGRVHCALVIAKARVAPVKQITVPRLELSAATTAVRIDDMLRREMHFTGESCFWTDSMSVLHYINNKTARFHTFVANRLAVIHDGSNTSQWRHVPTSMNPADDCSRGQTVSQFIQNHRWMHGPDFLTKPESAWPTAYEEPAGSLVEDPEVKVNAVGVRADGHERSANDVIDKLLTHFSSWHRLKRAIGWILKVKHALRARVVSGKASEPKRTEQKPMIKLTTEDLHDAENAVIQYVQHATFTEEIEILKETSPDNSKQMQVKKRSSTYHLDPKMDDSLLRVGGRLNKAAMPEEAKHQAILPKSHRIVHLILREIHETKGHVGRNHMLSIFYQKYWAAGANATARKVVHDCVVCKRQRGKPETQKMADLPEERVRPAEPPFTNVGMDYFGPFHVKIGRSTVKRYGVIFTCLSSRAIHIEKADSLDTSACINAIRRFVARRGQVKVIRSDNGTNFVGAERELRAEIKKINQTRVHNDLIQRNIDWKFNAPGASHHGGVWERQIRSIRQVLCSVMREQTLSDDNLSTLFCEVEGILNSRPITKVSGDASDLEALTPNHLLLLKGQPILSPNLSDDKDQYARRRWKQVQYLANLFWRRWIKEYLPQLQTRQKWVLPQRNIQVGDIILIVDEQAPRNTWQMGKVIKVMPDKNGLVRQVQVRTKSTTLVRPVSKLCLLLEADN